MSWISLAISVVSFVVMQLIKPKPKIENARAAGLNSVQFPRAEEGTPIPMVFGKVFLRGPNTLWYGGFRNEPITQKVKTGLFSKKKQIIGFRYFLTMDLGLCLGGQVSLIAVHVGKTRFPISLTTDNSSGNITVSLGENGGTFQGTIRWYTGVDAAAQNAFMVTQTDAGYPSYPGLCHVVFDFKR